MTSSLETIEVEEDVFALEDALRISDNIEKADFLCAKPTTATASSLNGNTNVRFELNSTVNPLTIYDSFLKITVKLY